MVHKELVIHTCQRQLIGRMSHRHKLKFSQKKKKNILCKWWYAFHGSFAAYWTRSGPIIKSSRGSPRSGTNFAHSVGLLLYANTFPASSLNSFLNKISTLKPCRHYLHLADTTGMLPALPACCRHYRHVAGTTGTLPALPPCWHCQHHRHVATAKITYCKSSVGMLAQDDCKNLSILSSHS